MHAVDQGGEAGPFAGVSSLPRASSRSRSTVGLFSRAGYEPETDHSLISTR